MSIFLKLINNERKNRVVLSAKGCAADYCVILDYARCGGNAIDICEIDYSSCNLFNTDLCAEDLW